jgi:hypothetical protein
MSSRQPKLKVEQLSLPNDIDENSEGQEVLRAFIVDSGLSVSMAPLAFGEPDTWGLLLVDVARHVSRAYESEGQGQFETTMGKIREMFDAEWDRPTDMGTTQKHSKQ